MFINLFNEQNLPQQLRVCAAVREGGSCGVKVMHCDPRHAAGGGAVQANGGGWSADTSVIVLWLT